MSESHKTPSNGFKIIYGDEDQDLSKQQLKQVDRLILSSPLLDVIAEDPLLGPPNDY